MTTILTLREKVIIFVFLVLLGLGAYKFYSYKNYMEKQYEIASNIAQGMTPKLQQVTDENGRLHGVVDAMDVDKKAYIATNRVYIDSIAKLTKTKPKSIKSITTIGITTNGHITIPPEHSEPPTSIDTQVINGNTQVTVTYPINFSDSFLTLNGVANIINSDLSLQTKYSIVDSILIVNKMKKTGFLGLGKPKLQMDISSTNRNSKVTYAKTVDLTTIDRRKWSVGAGIFYGYDGTSFKPFIGVGISRTIFRW